MEINPREAIWTCICGEVHTLKAGSKRYHGRCGNCGGRFVSTIPSHAEVKIWKGRQTAPAASSSLQSEQLPTKSEIPSSNLTPASGLRPLTEMLAEQLPQEAMKLAAARK